MTGPNPILEALEHDWQRIRHPHHHDQAATATQTPATQPVSLAPAPAAATAPQKGTTMSFATLDEDVKTDLTDGLNWLTGFATRLQAAAPGIIATTEAVSGSTLGALAEGLAGRILPPQLEQVAVDFVKNLADKYAVQPVTAQPAAAQPPAGQ